jgi:hypothetical protein
MSQYIGVRYVLWDFSTIDGEGAFAVDAAHVAEELFGPGDGVGGEDDVVHRAEGRVGTERFFFEDIEGGTGDAAGLEGLDEGLFLHDGAAGGVDEHGSGFHAGELGGAEQAAGVGCERTVHENVVGFGEEVVEGDEFDAELGSALRLGVGIEGEEAAHVEDPQEADSFRRDVAKADGANDAIAGFAAEGLGAFYPLALTDEPVLLEKPVGECEDEKEDGFGNRADDPAGGDVDGDPLLCAGDKVDIVITDAAAPDGTEAGDAFERTGRDAGLEGDEYVETGKLHGFIFGAVVAEEFAVDGGVGVKQRQAQVGKRERAVFAAEVGGEGDLEGYGLGTGKAHALFSRTTTQS